MIRLAGAALGVCALLLSQEAQARPDDQTSGHATGQRIAPHDLGRPVILSDGVRIGRVVSSWPDGPGTRIVQIRLDQGAGFGHDALTLIVPEPTNPLRPIRLLLDHGALRDLISAPTR